MICKFLKKKVAEYIKWFKSYPNKRVWPTGLVKLYLGSDLYTINDTGMGLLFRKIRQDGDGMCLTTLYFSFSKYCIGVHISVLPSDVMIIFNFSPVMVQRIFHYLALFASLL